jgi:hypothetical protein
MRNVFCKVTAAFSAALLMAWTGALAQSGPTDGGAPAPAAKSGPGGAAIVVVSNSISSSGSPNMPDRPTRNGVPSVCGSVKPAPGINAGANFAYQTASYTNSGPARCVTFTLTASCTGGGNTFGAFLSAYGGAFDPNNLATNFIGDTGVSTGNAGGTPAIMKLDMTSGQAITLMVNQVNDDTTNPASVCSYTVADDTTLVPTNSATGLILMALALAALGFYYLRRRPLHG